MTPQAVLRQHANAGRKGQLRACLPPTLKAQAPKAVQLALFDPKARLH